MISWKNKKFVCHLLEFLSGSLGPTIQLFSPTPLLVENLKKGELVAFIEMPVYLPSGFSEDQIKEHEAAYEEFARMLVMKFDGRGHWAKNRNWLFSEGISRGMLDDNLNSFQKVLTKWDPKGLFSNQFGKTLGLSWSNWEDDDCTDHYTPVCDKTGRRFTNICQARKLGIFDFKKCVDTY